MATLYQLHSAMDSLRHSTSEMALTWRAGDSILLLGTTVAFIEWLDAYLGDSDIQGVQAIYALAEDVAQLSATTTAKLTLSAKLTGILSDAEWVTITQNAQFDKVVTIAL